ncbi:MAG: hypothetical protein LBE92_04210 [Chryseobacterium sp.]|jgi:hypothetical protein|uniref:hypothetical protein n=1 Tax=Chryseobacterium sp. TaxID=1871047 RepID=UPI00282F1D7A|nr:hypothetical protein [Chryseobacterium sp.]MDR2235307.1 hypothetical protein [Chryseobacterium sp.]
MKTDNNFSKFVARLEQKMLDSNQESMIIHSSGANNYMGAGANSTCSNAAASCNDSNNRNCTNNNSSGCSGATNTKTLFGSGCQNTEKELNPSFSMD